MENEQMRENKKKVRRILDEHGYCLNTDHAGNFCVYSDYSRYPNKFKTLVSLVDYYKPILLDSELTAMYN